MARSPVLEVTDARIRYLEREALRGVSLELHEGEIVGLLGPNGAGKTTLVRAICGRLPLSSGTIRVAGKDPLHSDDTRRHIGFVPQAIALFPELTARENLEVLGRLAGLDRARLRPAVEEALDWAQLQDRADERSDRLSGGMQRRLNLVAATLHRPRLLLLDEPTVGVDPAARQVIHDLLESLRDRGVAILLTTHDLQQAADLSDRIAILSAGEIRGLGTLDELLHGTFGDRRELSVRLGESPPPDEPALAALGLETASDDRRLWTGALRGGLDSLPRTGAALEAAGLPVEEIRIREPDLRGVFFRLTGEEIDA